MILKKGEHVVFEVRRHWYVLARESGFIVLMALVPLFILGGFNYYGFDEELLLPILALCAGWLTILWTLFFVVWTNYYLDVWIITDERIVDIEQFSLFNRDISEFRMDRIQDITIDVKGMIPTLMGFGNLHVQTAGMHHEFHIMEVPNPYGVKDRITRIHDRAVDRAHEHSHGGL
ncbi:MAG: PH domain-containing protein [Candidatus Colwellbacteria bacterium]|nr:PH domain-containing protein [Candidatus Colwellbacteria bacterium]